MKFSIVNLLCLAAFTSALPQSSNSACTNSQVGISDARATQIRAAFSGAKIVPQAVAQFNPKVEVTVKYDTGQSANLGTTIGLLPAALAPDISFTAEADQDPTKTKYLILFVDPDAPSPKADGTRNILGFFLHEAIWNASPRCVNSAKNGGGETVTVPNYRSLTPLSVEKHRYIQLVYRQPPGFQRPNELALTTASFDLNAFVSSKGLVNVGGNFFRAGALDVISG